MDRNEVEHVARVSGKEAAQETLIGLGIDTTKPIETQRDFAHLRWWREIAEGVMKAAVIAMALGFGGTLAAVSRTRSSPPSRRRSACRPSRHCFRYQPRWWRPGSCR
ncbi:MAG: hypothetical protein WB822_04040 [Rhodoplanes sp.]